MQTFFIVQLINISLEKKRKMHQMLISCNQYHQLTKLVIRTETFDSQNTYLFGVEKSNQLGDESFIPVLINKIRENEKKHLVDSVIISL